MINKAALIEKADAFFQAKGYQTRVVNTQDEFDVETELENHQWADIVFLQSPINWMGMTWSFKKYMDEVYTAGMGGALCHGDGRHQDNPKANYGKGGTLTNTQYMMSLTLNAPAESFADATDFFEGKSVDDLVFPMHMNFKFFGMQGLPTFACFDVMKNADIDSDFARFEKHLNENF
ncbi:NAD(P)H-dependent oxidoreductase [Pseudoalteromonas sp. BZP1]|uniref:NAD(P)H-dependent oxidoreductase n=1 Tax=unclassified Pseudoalteromonas TaxID=194690 RepID=UPI0032C47566